MNTIIVLKVCLFLALGLTAFLLLSYLKEHKVLSSVAETVYEKARAQEEDRQSEQQQLLLIEGRQEKTNLLYKLDLIVLQSNIRKLIPFASTEILLVLTSLLAASGFAVVTSMTGTWIFGLLGFIGVCFFIYMVLYFMALSNYRKTEESLMTFINLLENYSSMEDELIAIFSRIQTFLTEPVKSAVEQCCMEAGIQVNKKEYVVMGLIYATVEIILFSFYGYGREFGCHSLILFYLIFAAFIDHKTKRVYRIGSIVFILLSVGLFIAVKDMSVYERVERTICILIFSMIVIMQGTLGWMGWGDVLTYIGAFFWLGTWKYDHITLELLATYMLLANVFFLIINVRRFDWKKKRFKEEVAFLPGMAVAMMIMELSRMLI